MCGRYALYAEGNEELREILDRTEGEYKTGEIFPTDKAPILVQKNGGIRSVAVSWGFPAFKGKERYYQRQGRDSSGKADVPQLSGRAALRDSVIRLL